ncbi:MAG: hypothetical protein HYV36_04405 [Lentisphaerae bacterium]|nr:hypothetical protein [Lentisphaerota bacterium]
MSHSPKHVLEYLAMRSAAGLIQRLSYRAALGLGWGIAALSFYVLRYRAALAAERIREVFGAQYSRRTVERIAWRAWRNFCFTVVEMARIPVSSPDWVRSIVDDNDSIRKITAHTQNGRGAIIAVAHLGSWELAALASQAYGLRLFSVAADQKNPLVNEFINRMRGGTGFETLSRSSGVLKSIISRIREGKVMAILPDVRSRTPGVAIRFLGKTANIAGGMGLIAKMTGVPVFPCVITRQGWMHHRYRVMDPVWPDERLEKTEDWRRITQAVFDVFDRAIRAQPEQWFWFNKRWILDPLAPAEDGGPRATRGKRQIYPAPSGMTDDGAEKQTSNIQHPTSNAEWNTPENGLPADLSADLSSVALAKGEASAKEKALAKTGRQTASDGKSSRKKAQKSQIFTLCFPGRARAGLCIFVATIVLKLAHYAHKIKISAPDALRLDPTGLE